MRAHGGDASYSTLPFSGVQKPSPRQAAGALARLADIWHVAAALEIGCNAFSSSGDHPRKLAAISKLKLLPV
jgi:hypothetical protein